MSIAFSRPSSTGGSFGALTGAPGDNAALAAALALKLDKAGGTMTGALINSRNGAASTPALCLTGSPFTGGTGTTTKPLVLIEPAGTTSNTWPTDGTMLGINAPSGFANAASILDARLNGALRFSVSGYGDVTVKNSLQFNTSGNVTSFNVSGTSILCYADSSFTFLATGTDFRQGSTYQLTWTDGWSFNGTRIAGLALGSAGYVKVTNGTTGIGSLQFGTHSALAAETVTGYITVKDGAGTTRKLAVVS